MKKQKKDRGYAALFIGIVCLAVVSMPAYGHHGTGIAYDNTKPTVIKGTVTDFEWKNQSARPIVFGCEGSGRKYLEMGG